MSDNRAQPLGDAIDRIRQLATEATDHLILADGPPHPDYKLLEICAEIGERRKEALAASEAKDRGWKMAYCATPQEIVNNKALSAASDAADRAFSHLLRAAAKIRATTSAGIYAKAIAIRASKTGAAGLAMSLADDLITCPGLRASLWPAEVQP
jgi:hypothetical protein